MTDLVERLRKASVYEEYKAILSNLGDEAADEIELLRAALRDVRAEMRSKVEWLEAEIGALKGRP
jgi:hypothetical protein